jgi:hypothetical protein
VFPDGRFLSRRWRRVGIAAAACFVTFMTLGLFDPTPFDDDPSIRNPVAGNAFGDALVGTGIWIPFWLGILGSLIAGIAWMATLRVLGSPNHHLHGPSPCPRKLQRSSS